MKVIFMGTPDFSTGVLESIIEAGHEVTAVVTQPDKPKGRGKALQYSPVKEAALSHNLEVLQPVKARDEAFIEKLRQYNADVFVVVAYGQILPKEIIDMPKYGCINVHASLLPKYRGAAPIQYAVIDGCEYSGVTTMLMDEGLDTGDILLVSKVKLDKKETGGSLFDKLEDVGAKLLVTTLSKLEDGTITRTKQIEEDSTYVKMIKKSMGKIDFNKSAVEIERLIRGLNPWPSAYTSLDGKTFKIWEANCLSDVEYDSSKLTEIKPGMVIKINKNSFVIKCQEGYLEALSVQLEGKKRMDAGSFLRGYNLEEGTIFNS
jgi:methionyl-tRNA formyltransferase